ncbi:MAG: hypothetical protein Q9202_007253 [Teloschistes flavicans]
MPTRSGAKYKTTQTSRRRRATPATQQQTQPQTQQQTQPQMQQQMQQQTQPQTQPQMQPQTQPQMQTQMQPQMQPQMQQQTQQHDTIPTTGTRRRGDSSEDNSGMVEEPARPNKRRRGAAGSALPGPRPRPDLNDSLGDTLMPDSDDVGETLLSGDMPGTTDEMIPRETIGETLPSRDMPRTTAETIPRETIGDLLPSAAMNDIVSRMRELSPSLQDRALYFLEQMTRNRWQALVYPDSSASTVSAGSDSPDHGVPTSSTAVTYHGPHRDETQQRRGWFAFGQYWPFRTFNLALASGAACFYIIATSTNNARYITVARRASELLEMSMSINGMVNRYPRTARRNNQCPRGSPGRFLGEVEEEDEDEDEEE